MSKIYKNLHKIILQYISGRRFFPMGQKELFKKAGIDPKHKIIAEEIITSLINEGVIEIRRQTIYLTKQKKDVIRGTLRTHPRGFGFVIPDVGDADIFIPKQMMGSAIDGDKVEVAINPDSNWEKGPDGEVISIIDRQRKTLAGTIYEKKDNGSYFAFSPILGASRMTRVKSHKNLKDGERIIMKIIDGPDRDSGGLCEYIETIGHIDSPKDDIKAATLEYSLRSIFPKECVKEAKKFGKKVSKDEMKEREDLTHLTSFTIDPETAKDFDDALTISKEKNGNFHLAVHIADVAHYVKAGSALDEEAQKRCNSTYLPGTCIPMLPEELSNNLCSLKPKVNRLTASVIMTFDKRGNLTNSRITRGVIHSCKRFTYEDALDVLEGRKKSTHKGALDQMLELCKLLKEQRHERGSIDFSLPEYVVQIKKNGVPTGMKKIEYDITHQLVEEFMLKANEVVAKTLTDKGFELLYRVHDEPKEESMKDFCALARSLGFQLADNPYIEDLQELFDKAKKTPHGQQLSIGFIRSMKQAVYSKDNVGHFGLALDHYCHFTSPIRRYSDLIIQRLLFNEEMHETNLSKIALRCSEQERISFRAEQSVKLLKKLRLLDSWNKDDPERTFKAFVTKIKPFGITFEIEELMFEGFLHISEIGNDFYHFNPKTETLKAEKKGELIKVGTKLNVIPIRVDLILLEAKWERR